MTDYRERAIKDVAEAFDVNERVVSARLKVAANCECYIDVHTKYAVAQREARLRLEDELKQSRKDALEEATEIAIRFRDDPGELPEDIALACTNIANDIAIGISSRIARAALNAVKEG